MLLALPVALLAQGDLEGRVTTDAGRVPVPRAIVRLPVLGRATTSDSLGRFTFVDVASGEQLIVIRALGYDAESTKVSIPESQRLVRDFVLARIPATTLSGAKAGFCYMDVMVDGALVYRHDQPAPAQLYDLNSIPTEQLEGIEVFTSTAQMPAQYNRTGSGCGLLVIWTRVSK